jgi:hypothetical protein
MPWKKNRRLRGLRAIPAGNEGSYPFDSCSLCLAINPVKGTRSPQPVENLMEHLLRRYLSQRRQIQLRHKNHFGSSRRLETINHQGPTPLNQIRRRKSLVNRQNYVRNSSGSIR